MCINFDFFVKLFCRMEINLNEVQIGHRAKLQLDGDLNVNHALEGEENKIRTTRFVNLEIGSMLPPDSQRK